MKVGDIVSTKFIHFLQDGDSEVVEELGIVCHVDWTNQTVGPQFKRRQVQHHIRKKFSGVNRE
jgi:hypothetical protein